MVNHSTQSQQRENIRHKKTITQRTSSEITPERLSSATASFSDESQSDVPLTTQNILYLLRTVGNQAGKRTIHANPGSQLFWGASLGISSPRPVTWGTMPDSDQLQPGVTGVEAIVPPVGTDLLTVQKHSGGKDEVGLTHFPTMFKAPQFDFNTFSKAPIKALPKKGPKKKASKEWYAQPKLLVKAYEGDADSFFVTPGLHKTQHKEKVIPLVPKAAKAPKGKAPKAPKLAPVFVDVYWNFSKAMSSRDRDAEQEHVDDFMHAYKISLQEAEDVLTTHILGNIFGPKPTEAAAKKMVLNTIKSKLTHPKLGNNQTKWAAKYDMLFRKTLIRDNKNWHTFHLDHRKEIKDIKGKVVKVSYEIIKGTTKIGVVKSAKIIKY